MDGVVTARSADYDRIWSALIVPMDQDQRVNYDAADLAQHAMSAGAMDTD